MFLKCGLSLPELKAFRKSISTHETITNNEEIVCQIEYQSQHGQNTGHSMKEVVSETQHKRFARNC